MTSVTVNEGIRALADALNPIRLTEWNKEPTVMDLKKDLQNATSSHQTQVSKIDQWLDNLHVRGSAKVKKARGRSTIVPKLIRKQAEWRYAALSEPFLSQENLFKASPFTHADTEAARQSGLVLNHQFNTKLDRVRFIDQYVRAVVNEGTAIIRVGWDYQEQEKEVEEPVYGLQPVMDPQIASEMLAQGQQPVEEVQIGVRKVRKKVVTRNQPTLDICDYRSVIIDPTAKDDFTKANFVIYSFETSLSELEKSNRYKNLDRIDIENNSALSAPDSLGTNHSHDFNFADRPRKKFIAYEYWGYWDIHDSGATSPFVATWVGNTMIRLEETPFPDGELPFVVVPFLPVKNSVYGEPDGELLEDNQKINGAVTRGMIDIMGRSANGQVGIRQDALDVTNERKFEMGMDYKFAPHIDPRAAFFTHTYPEIPNSAQFMMQLQNMEAESLSGVKAFSGGISGESYGATATGAKGAMTAQSQREMGILRRLVGGLVQVGRKIMAMNAEFLSDEEVIRITDEEFVTISKDDLAGRYDVILDISSAEVDNAKAQELAFMLQTVGNSMPPQFSQMILGEIARLRKMPRLAQQIETFQPQPDPMAQQRAQLEMELLAAQVANEQAKAAVQQSMLQVNSSKSRLMESQADSADLGFIEQETGVTQERDLEKHGAQAKANAEMRREEYAMKQENDLMKILANQQFAKKD